MVASILLFISILLTVIPILILVLPNFKKQKQLASLASLLNMSDIELRTLNQNKMVRLFSERILPRIDRKWSIEHLFGRKFFEKYNSLGRSETYMEYIAGILLKALILVPPVIFLYFVLKEPLVLLLAPAAVIILFYAYLYEINRHHKNRQNLLIKDLPNLISKMILALETGKSFTHIFNEVADQANPLLSDMIKRLIANSQIMPQQEALQLFAQEVDLPVMYDFISVINIGMEKGYKEAIPDFNSIKNDLRELRRLSLIEQTKGNPEKMNIFYAILCVHIVIFLFMTFTKMFSYMNSIQ